MARFHVNADFEVKKCSAASVERCKFFRLHGNGINHYDSEEEAYLEAQSLMDALATKIGRSTVSGRRARPRPEDTAVPTEQSAPAPVNPAPVAEQSSAAPVKTVAPPKSVPAQSAAPKRDIRGVAPREQERPESPVAEKRVASAPSSPTVDATSRVAPQPAPAQRTEPVRVASNSTDTVEAVEPVVTQQPAEVINPNASERFKREAASIMHLLPTKNPLPMVRNTEEMIRNWFNGSERDYLAMRNIAASQRMNSTSKASSASMLLSGMRVNVLNRNVADTDRSVPRGNDVSSIVIDATDDTIDVLALKRGISIGDPYIRRS
jgi:hypothetical protein